MSSEYRELLDKLLNSDTTDVIPQSRSEYIMLTAINSLGLETLPEPGSRMEAYLMALIAKMGEGGSASGDVDLSGYIKSPTPAAVGQTIRVFAVDENGQPTEWEAVDMINGASEWELINEATLTEDVISEITISEDSNGNPFELSAVYVLIFGKGSVDSGIKIEIQSTTNEAHKNVFHNFGLLSNCLSTDGKWSAAYIEHICNTEWNTAFKGYSGGAANPAATQNYDAYISMNYSTWQAKPDGNIRAVQLTPFSGTFSSGAKLILYGKRV